MQIIRLNNENEEKVRMLFNSIAQNEIVHKRLSEDRFNELFIAESSGLEKINFIASDYDKVVGFANACYKADTNTGYITFVAVEISRRRDGIGRALLHQLEQELYNLSNSAIEKYEISFFNPINLEWCVPNTPEHDHPNAPGVDVASDAYLFFKNCGYRDTAYQNSFYQPLHDFELSSSIKQRIDGLSKHELAITYYDKDRHFGLDELFTDLGNEQWREIIMANLDTYPILLAEHNGKAVGFTGPLYVQPSGRGYFAGIGVHSEYRKYGLGKALFSSLCLSLKDLGAGYMTLFTGETNPARNIYEEAGFKIVRSWTDMERIIKG